MSTSAVASASSRSFFVTGGTLPVASSSYIARQADTDLYNALHDGQYCYLLNTRQMGKSSLMVRIAQRLKDEGDTVCVLDLTAVGQNVVPDQWYDGLLYRIGEQTDAEDALEAFWQSHSHLSPMQRFFGAIAILLPRVPNRLVLFVDEIDAVRSLPFAADEFFAGLRECYNRRATEPLYERLVVCLIGVATPSDLISDTRVSPFNVGQRIVIHDFTETEALPLAQRLGEQGESLLRRVMYWTGGHPYLTQRLCRECSATGANAITDVDRLAHSLFLGRAGRETDDNLSFVRNRLLRSEYPVPDVLDLYHRIHQGKRIPDDESNPLYAILRLSGVCKAHPETRHLQVRNRLYAEVFNREFVRENMPDAELRRQQRAVVRARWQVVAIAATVLAAVGILSIQLAITAERAKTALHQFEQEQQRRKVQEEKTRSSEALADTLRHSNLLAQQQIDQQKVAVAHWKAESARLLAQGASTQALEARKREKEASARLQQSQETKRVVQLAQQNLQNPVLEIPTSTLKAKPASSGTTADSVEPRLPIAVPPPARKIQVAVDRALRDAVDVTSRVENEKDAGERVPGAKNPPGRAEGWEALRRLKALRERARRDQVQPVIVPSPAIDESPSAETDETGPGFPFPPNPRAVLNSVGRKPILDIIEGLIPAEPLAKPKPAITNEMKRTRPRPVVVEFTIDSDGSSTYRRINSSGNDDVDRVIEDACDSYRWRAATRNGKPVRTVQRIRFNTSHN